MPTNLTDHLTSDVGYYTLSYLPHNDLSRVCRISKATVARATALLYRRIELLCLILRESRMSVVRRGTSNYKDCHRRQQLFCKTILARPELALFVRELSWTLDFSIKFSQQARDRQTPSRLVPLQRLPSEDVNPREIWQTFQSLHNVAVLYLDIRNIFLTPSAQSLIDPFSHVPSILFPNAYSVKLSGKCNVGFAKTIVTHNPQRLRHLAIDHLELTGGSSIGWPVLVQDALPTLTSFTFRKTGASSPREPFNLYEERATYVELATVLESVRESVRHIHIGSTRRPRECVYTMSPGEIGVSQKNFQDLILPVFTRGKWPNLESITLEGLGVPLHAKDKCGKNLNGTPCAVYRAIGPVPGRLRNLKDRDVTSVKVKFTYCNLDNVNL